MRMQRNLLIHLPDLKIEINTREHLTGEALRHTGRVKLLRIIVKRNHTVLLVDRRENLPIHDHIQHINLSLLGAPQLHTRRHIGQRERDESFRKFLDVFLVKRIDQLLDEAHIAVLREQIRVFGNTLIQFCQIEAGKRVGDLVVRVGKRFYLVNNDAARVFRQWQQLSLADQAQNNEFLVRLDHYLAVYTHPA